MDQDAPHKIAASIISRLVLAWNTANGEAWGAEFVEDADFINIFGVQRRGRAEIEKRNRYVFDVLFAGSTCEMVLVDARPLAPNVILAHSKSVLKIPGGPMKGEQLNRQTLVIVRDGDAWRIATYHNTLVSPQL